MTEQLEQVVQKENQAHKVSPLLVMFFLSSLVGFAAAAVLLLNSERNSPSDETAQVLSPSSGVRSLRDWEADPFTLPSLDGNTISLADYKGRVVFLNFWRTDCAPCVRELPAFEAFASEQDAETGAVVLVVNQGENEEQIAAFLDEIGITGLIVLLDETSELAANYPIPGLPTTYVIAEDGFVRLTRLGEMSYSQMNQYLDEVRG